jgi:hypothetical protein
VFEHYLVRVRDAVAPLVRQLVEQGRVRAIPMDVMVFAVVAMNSVDQSHMVRVLRRSTGMHPSGLRRWFHEGCLPAEQRYPSLRGPMGRII